MNFEKKTLQYKKNEGENTLDFRDTISTYVSRIDHAGNHMKSIQTFLNSTPLQKRENKGECFSLTQT